MRKVRVAVDCKDSMTEPRAGLGRNISSFHGGRPRSTAAAARRSAIIRAMRFVLASASPRRRDLLSAAGFDFDVHPVDVDEARRPGEPAAEYVVRLAAAKAQRGALEHIGRVVLGADTTVVVDGAVLGKPEDDVDAARMLRLLSGRAHEVLTGVAAARRTRLASAVETTMVWMAELTDEDLVRYVASGEPAGKAGAYAIQGLASRFVTRIEGSYANVVGLPVARVPGLLAAVAD